MKAIPNLITLVILATLLTNCNDQPQSQTGEHSAPTDNLVGGGCDGCELMFVGTPENISSIDTSAGWAEAGQKLLLKGTVFELGGKIPVPNVLIYYWQTDNTGHYTPVEGMAPQAKRHGHIRGWVKSDENGKYAVYTIRPAPYPDRDIPAHIHLSIKEPSIDDEYYIDALVFDDDILLTSAKRNVHDNRGGSGILNILTDKGLQIAEHNIILGLNIPNYPETIQPE